MREYSIIHKAKSADKLKLQLKEGDQEKYGEPFTPDYIYNAINYLPRFSSMRVSVLSILRFLHTYI